MLPCILECAFKLKTDIQANSERNLTYIKPFASMANMLFKAEFTELISELSSDTSI